MSTTFVLTPLSAPRAQVQGGKVLKLPVRAEVVVPEVEVLQDEFGFGPVYLGALGRLQVTLANNTSVPALLSVDLVRGCAHPAAPRCAPTCACTPC